MGDFSIKAVAQKKVLSWVLMVVCLGAAVALLICGALAPDKDAGVYYVHGGLGVFGFLLTLVLHYSSLYIFYEDEDDHLRVRFGPGCCFNVVADFCCCCGSNCLNGKIRYEDIDRVDYTNSTCLDGCGIDCNHNRDAIYTTGCCVPAVEVYSNNSGCCFSGRYVLGVENKTQAEELMLKINEKITANAVV